MEKFSADNLRWAVTILETIRCQATHMLPRGDAAAAMFLHQKPLLSNADIQELRNQFESIRTALLRSGLPTSAEASAEFCLELGDPNLSRPSPSEVAARVEDMQRTIRREMKTVVFLNIQPKNSRWYNTPLDGWDKAVSRWPKIRMDVEPGSGAFRAGVLVAVLG
jgi:hypothetical protein